MSFPKIIRNVIPENNKKCHSRESGNPFLNRYTKSQYPDLCGAGCF
jgi:hypothetical protein